MNNGSTYMKTEGQSNEPLHHHDMRFASVILPIKFQSEIFYIIPQDKIAVCKPGSWIKVSFARRYYRGVVRRVASQSEMHAAVRQPSRGKKTETVTYKEITDVLDTAKVTPEEIRFWEIIARYYLCTIGEVFKAAYPVLTVKQEDVKAKTTAEEMIKAIRLRCPDNQIVLSEAQQKALKGIKEDIETKPVLLHGVTGSGKTEIYLTLADEQIAAGKSVLYLVPEIAMSKQLEMRLKKHFGKRLFIFHSGLTQATKKLVRDILTSEDKEPVVILGTRSSIFLPFKDLGLVIIDEEHDQSYKQEEPAPRYNGRDAAIILARIHNAKVLLGSATPSLESLYNCRIGRFAKTDLAERYYSAENPEVTVVDTIWTRHSRQMKGDFSQQLINEIRNTIGNKGQVIVFRNMRSYSPVVQCTECGEIPKCPHCNVPLSYHKYDNTLRCHYCEYQQKFTGICPKCSNKSLECKGSGTEKLEEELKELFPEAAIARFDADVAKRKLLAEKVLNDFAEGKTDILVGTQMISKGFDFKNLNLVAVIQADTILGLQDFRADEKAIQLFSQLMGRTGRREKRGKLIIQTNQKNHPVIQHLLDFHPDRACNANSTDSSVNAGSTDVNDTAELQLLEERKMFCFPPYVKLVTITIKHSNRNKLNEIAGAVSRVLTYAKSFEKLEATGPFPPKIDRIRNEYRLCFNVKFARDKKLENNKDALKKAIDSLDVPNNIFLDADPV